MKNRIGSRCLRYRVLLVLLFVLPGLMAGAGEKQNEKQNEKKDSKKITGPDPIVEDVSVTNVRVPVRVLHDGEPVTGLTRDDFTLRENGKKININGFFVKRKRLELPAATVTVKKEHLHLPRTFVLAFRISQYNVHMENALAHLFDKTFRDIDRLLVMVGDRTREYPNLEDKAAVRQQIVDMLKEQGHRVRRDLFAYSRQVETYLRAHDFRRTDTGGAAPGGGTNSRRIDQLVNFLKKYLDIYGQFKREYLDPRVDRFYLFAKYLENVETEKWVFSFYQFDLFPQIRLDSETMEIINSIALQLTNSNDPTAFTYSRLINSLLSQIALNLTVNSSFPTESIAKLFYKVDATFHSFFIRRLDNFSMSDLDYQEVSSDVEETLKQITRVTGGRNMTSNNLVQSLETVSQLEDTYYILTYAPPDPTVVGRLQIKVKSKGKKFRVLYDDNFRADYISDYLRNIEKKLEKPEIKIRDFQFDPDLDGGRITFVVRNYRLKDTDGKRTGRFRLRMRLMDEYNVDLLDRTQTFNAATDETQIVFSLNEVPDVFAGGHVFMADVTDLFTGVEATVVKEIIVR